MNVTYQILDFTGRFIAKGLELEAARTQARRRATPSLGRTQLVPDGRDIYDVDAGEVYVPVGGGVLARRVDGGDLELINAQTGERAS